MNIELTPKMYTARLRSLIDAAIDLQRCGRTIVALCEPTCTPLTHVEVQELQIEASKVAEAAANIIRQTECLGMLSTLADMQNAPERKERPRMERKSAKLMSTKELAKAFSVCTMTVYRWQQEGAPSVIVGSPSGKKITRRYDPAKVKVWLEERKLKKEATDEND